MKFFRRGCLLSLALILLPIVAWLACEIFHSATSNPKGLVATYSDYRKNMPQPIIGQIFQKESTKYYATVGPIRTALAFPSGPPVYVFDADGRMIDWSCDMGDDWRFQKTWDTWDVHKISISQLDAIMPKDNITGARM